MEEKASIGPAMVSRLPKFGGRPSTSGTSPLCNGSTQPATPTQDGKTATPGPRPNGLIRPSPFSLKWKREEGITSSSPTIHNSPGDGNGDKAQSQPPSLAKEVKNSSPATPKMRRSGTLMVAVSSPKAIPKQSSKMSPRVGAKLGQSPLNGVSKMGLNGPSIPARTVSESRLVRPMLGSTSPRSISQDSLSQSNESLKIMTIDNMVRSNSFTHFKQIPSPTGEPITRSFSFNRAVELAKPLANTQLRPPRSSFLKPPQLSNGRVGLGLNGSLGGSGCLRVGVGHQYSKAPAVASSLPNPSVSPAPGTPRALKKPLLPNSVLNKSLASTGGSLGYRLAQSGQAKQQIPLFPDQVKQDVRSSAAPEYEGLLGIAVDSELTEDAGKECTYCDSDEISRNGVEIGGESGVQNCGQTAGETLEDMSLSSASSLDRGDTSEEFLDDFDSVGDVLSDGDVPDNRKSDSSTETPLHNVVNEAVDWESVNLAEHKEESPMQDSQESLVLSPEQGDVPQTSSVELSPSNSSGGTYMWDEEGLEPIGRHGTNPLDSYDDSEFNSMDILNNLDPPGTEDLDDDDLMLDVDLSEDGFHDFNRMSHNELPERASRQGQRRKHHRYSGPDHFYNNSRAHIFQHYGGLNASRISSGPVQSEGRQHDLTPVLDEVALEHMTQDCTLLKNQLLRLKTLLQLEETDSTTDVSEETEDSTTASQLDVLLKEVQMLREELRSRDKTIAHLTSQCQQLQQQHQQEQKPYQGQQVRYQSQHQRAPSSLRQSDRQMDKRTQHHYDKATQTYWKPPSHSGMLPTALLSPWQAQHQGLTRTSMPQRRQRVEHLVQYFTDTACLKYYSLSTFVSANTSTREGL
ncbi:serine-rich coiled-coil domain-containing protein 2 isoform X2 [Melanotaenia boesemani]|uniref:serine-rich coiled-coil domain-containing protein 2 isoform X2 n=1 Tax=Melanotaenia boesemani TaxID=1250792 RepID=UPI001C03F97C|nr:serine-rich coiled-coil domain-containing protein 2 isoform X2 [Melanotaenia boesemani]